MKKKLVIFGTSTVAQLAQYYFDTDSDYRVVAFTVDRSFCDRDYISGLPVVPFEEVARLYPPEEYFFFVALGYSSLNTLRHEKFIRARAMGYTLASYISSRATVLTQYELGENCFLLEDNTVQPFVEIGENVTLWSGNHIGHHAQIESHTFISSHVVVSGGVRIGESCFIGVNSTLRDQVIVGDRCVIGAGSLITQDAAADGVYGAAATPRSKVPSSRLRSI